MSATSGDMRMPLIGACHSSRMKPQACAAQAEGVKPLDVVVGRGAHPVPPSRLARAGSASERNVIVSVRMKGAVNEAAACAF